MLGNDKKTSLSQEEFVDVVNAIESFTTINSLMTGSSEAVGVKYSFYQHFPAVGAVDFSYKGSFHGYNVPDNVKSYLDTKYKYDAEPIMFTAFIKGSPMWISDTIHEPHVKKTGSEKAIQWVIETFGDGLCCPLYGPDNRKGYTYIGFGRDKAEFDPIMPYQMQALAHIMHVRYCLMIKGLQRKINLTTRESEVLELISYGKTNSEIALILGISPHTVAGYTKQIFVKLDTTDRVSAAMRAQTINITI